MNMIKYIVALVWVKFCYGRKAGIYQKGKHKCVFAERGEPNTGGIIGETFIGNKPYGTSNKSWLECFKQMKVR